MRPLLTSEINSQTVSLHLYITFSVRYRLLMMEEQQGPGFPMFVQMNAR